MEQSQPSVAVITATTGREQLCRAIASVKAQSYACKHYIFVDGQAYHQATQHILADFTNDPNLIVTYLPMNTGADGWTNSSINAIAPFLVKEDILCFLDDDNWFEPFHVASCVAAIHQHQADYAYAMRNLYNQQGQFLAPDLTESLGFFERKCDGGLFRDEQTGVDFELIFFKQAHIDTNCYAMTRPTAMEIAPIWCKEKANDTAVFTALRQRGKKAACTCQFSVNYVLDLKQKAEAQVTLWRLQGRTEAEIERLLEGMIIAWQQREFELNGNKMPWQSGHF